MLECCKAGDLGWSSTVFKKCAPATSDSLAVDLIPLLDFPQRSSTQEAVLVAIEISMSMGKTWQTIYWDA